VSWYRRHRKLEESADSLGAMDEDGERRLQQVRNEQQLLVHRRPKAWDAVQSDENSLFASLGMFDSDD
jgi:hypothetical protein